MVGDVVHLQSKNASLGLSTSINFIFIPIFKILIITLYLKLYSFLFNLLVTFVTVIRAAFGSTACTCGANDNNP